MTLISTSARYAFRSLGRNLRRTLLSLVGVGVGCAIGLITVSWIRGEGDMIVRAAAECGAGHLRVVPQQWPTQRDRKLRLDDWESTLARVRADQGVKVATPRVRTQGLLGMGTRIQGAEIVGVDPTTEQAALRFVRRVEAGRYLRPDDEGVIVVGRKLLSKLSARLEDDLVVTVVGADGEMNSAMLRVIGVVATGSDAIDATIAQVNLPDAQRLSGIPGVGEITILVKRPRQADLVAAALGPQLADSHRLLAWYEVSPELRAGYNMDRGFCNVMVGIVIILVLLGVMSAQLTGVLERRREFAVLAALGMRGFMMVRVLLLESMLLGLLGSLLGLVIATPAVHYLATTGVDFTKLAGDQDMAMTGVLLDPIFRADMGLWMVPYALLLSGTATLVAALYPAFYATRTDPAHALRSAA